MEENKMQDNMSTDRGLLSKIPVEGESTDAALLKAKVADTDPKGTIEILNGLIGINNDRIVGYETALKETQDADLNALFLQFIQTSKKCRQELCAEVVRLGGTPSESTETASKYFRAWMDVKAVLAGHHSRTLLNWCESGEDMAVDTYDNILRTKSADITATQQTMVNAQYELIKADHNKIKGMRDLSKEQS
jgi:uncharacterized protein (TIGR02284 family)